MNITCDNCKHIRTVTDHIGKHIKCPTCGMKGQIRSVCSKCGKTGIAEPIRDLHKSSASPYHISDIVKCSECGFVGHWSDFRLVLVKTHSFLGIAF